MPRKYIKQNRLDAIPSPYQSQDVKDYTSDIFSSFVNETSTKVVAIVTRLHGTIPCHPNKPTG
jgi:hypothetical protein